MQKKIFSYQPENHDAHIIKFTDPSLYILNPISTQKWINYLETKQLTYLSNLVYSGDIIGNLISIDIIKKDMRFKIVDFTIGT